ncbi:MAG: hypothetical protein EPN93_13390 [Spirochaetes bacterium]|nr:MAG: hypothetical protein EPN93_13390 [Spirochaetota bacterium]
MKMKTGILTAAGIVAAAVVAIVIFGRNDPSADEISKRKKDPVRVRQFDERVIAGIRFADLERAGGGPLSFEEQVAYLRQRFGRKIAHAHTQVRVLDLLMRHCREQDADGWIACLQEYLIAAFPDLADEMFALFENYYKYQTWLQNNETDLKGLSNKERKRLLWEKRKALFGDALAEEIWAGEIRNDSILDAMEKIDKAGGSILDKLSMYKGSISSAYEEAAPGFVRTHQQEVMDRFLGMESVQAGLSAMPPDERARNLREVRKSMDMDEAALGRWEELDRSRDTRWDAGSAYMSARARLEEEYKGTVPESRLDEIRAKYFGTEAEAIRNEEGSGYFRFKEKRVWGKN